MEIIFSCIIIAAALASLTLLRKAPKKFEGRTTPNLSYPTTAELLRRKESIDAFQPPKKSEIKAIRDHEKLQRLESALYEKVAEIDNLITDFACDPKLMERGTSRLQAKGARILELASYV